MKRSMFLVATLMAVVLASPVRAACQVREEADQVVLENDHLRLVLAPSQGGKCSSFVFKAVQADLTSWPNYGSFEDRRWGPQGYERLRQVPYQAKVLQRGPDAVSVSLSARCAVPGFTELSVDKTVTLRDGEARAQVHYRWRNGAKTPLPLGWWFFQDLGIQGKKNTFYAPTPLGVERSVHTPGEGQNSEMFGRTADRFLYDPPRGWAGVISETGVGAAATFDVRHTSFIYTFASGRETTFEWAFNQVEVPAGGEFETTFEVFPIRDMPSVDGAGEGLAGSITTPGREGAWGKPAVFTAGEPVPIRVVVVGARREDVRLRVEARAWPDGEWKPVGERDLSLKPAEPAQAEFTAQPDWRATTVLRGVALRKDKPAFDMERPILYGVETGAYALKPLVEKVGVELATYRPKKESAAPRQTDPTLPEDYQPTRNAVTPHVPWATPWAGGKVSVLAPMHFMILRQLVDLAQRMDIEFETVAISTSGKEKISPAEMFLLQEKLAAAKYDVIILGDNDWNRLAEGVQKRILEQVEQGKGLVLAGPQVKLPVKAGPRDEFVASGVLEALQPAGIRLCRHGKGRIATLPFGGVFKGGVLAPSPVYQAHYVKPILAKYSDRFGFAEYTYAMAARLVLWAAGRTPAVSMALKPAALTAGAAGQTLAVALNNAGKEKVRGRLEWSLTDRWSQTAGRGSKQIEVEAGPQNAAVELPKLAAGPHVADVWLRRADGAVVNWATVALEPAGPVGVGRLATDRDLYADGDTLQAAVSLSLAEGAPATMALKWRIEDCFDRVLAEGRQPVKAQGQAAEATLSAQVRRPLARYAWLRVEAVDGESLLAAAVVGFAMTPLPEPHPFYFMSYGNFLESYREKFGCNTAFGVGERGMARTQEGLNLIAWHDIHRDFRVQEAGPEKVRPGCLTSPKFREEAAKGIDDYAKWAKLQGNLGILIADEWGYGGEGNRNSNYCHSPTCLAGFRDFLKKEYGTVQALNKSWNTQHASWDDVVPPTYEETQKSGLWERWTDHRRWIETEVADFFGFCVERARKTYPQARFGFSGTPNAGSFNGYDWTKLCRTMNIICAYGGPQGEILRSFKQPGGFTSAWTGYDRQAKNEKGHRFQPWFALFNDMDGLGYYISSYAPLHYPDHTWNPKAEWISEQWQDLRRGIATLVRHGKRQHDGIAIHYSQSSIHGATRLNRYEQLGQELTSLCQLLEDLGYQYDFVGYDAVERGELKGKYRLLILPFSQAMSAREAEQVADFVRSGGVVIADAYPAVRDQHGKGLAAGALDAVFGVKSDPADAPLFQPSTVEGEGIPADVRLPGGCAKVQATTGKAMARLAEMGGAPARIVNAYGKGRAVLLNFFLIGYSGYRAGGTGGEIAIVEQAKQKVRIAVSDLGRMILREAGLTAVVRVARADGSPYLDAEVVRYAQGPATYVGVLPSAAPGGSITKEDTERVALDFGSQAHVYDLRARKYMGQVSKVETELTRSVARVFALMPAKVEPVQVEIAGKVTREGGVPLVLSTADTSCDHVAHVAVVRPGNKPVWLYERDVILTKGRGEWTVPLALNDPAGAWRIEASDAVEGTLATATFSLP